MIRLFCLFGWWGPFAAAVTDAQVLRDAMGRAVRIIGVIPATPS